MISAKEAVASAARYMVDMYAESAEGLSVEEIEFDYDQSLWVVTMGFWRSVPNPKSRLSALADLVDRKVQRAYKELKVRAADGEVMSMKIRILPIIDPPH